MEVQGETQAHGGRGAECLVSMTIPPPIPSGLGVPSPEVLCCIVFPMTARLQREALLHDSPQPIPSLPAEQVSSGFSVKLPLAQNSGGLQPQEEGCREASWPLHRTPRSPWPWQFSGCESSSNPATERGGGTQPTRPSDRSDLRWTQDRAEEPSPHCRQ